MAAPYDRDEDSEYGGDNHHYYGTDSQGAAANGNYQKIIAAWAGFVTIVALAVIALIWNSLANQTNKNTEALDKLHDMTTRMEEQQKRQDERMDFIQKEVEIIQQQEREERRRP